MLRITNNVVFFIIKKDTAAILTLYLLSAIFKELALNFSLSCFQSLRELASPFILLLPFCPLSIHLMFMHQRDLINLISIFLFHLHMKFLPYFSSDLFSNTVFQAFFFSLKLFNMSFSQLRNFIFQLFHSKMMFFISIIKLFLGDLLNLLPLSFHISLHFIFCLPHGFLYQTLLLLQYPFFVSFHISFSPGELILNLVNLVATLCSQLFLSGFHCRFVFCR